MKLNGIKEYFIMKIASALKIGPQIKKYLGFDFIIYSNAVHFAMEKCESAASQV